MSKVVNSHHHSDTRVPCRSTQSRRRDTPTAPLPSELELLADPDRPLRNEVFDHTLTIEARDHSLQLDYPGPSHSKGNSFIYLPSQRVLMRVDAIFSRRGLDLSALGPFATRP